MKKIAYSALLLWGFCYGCSSDGSTNSGDDNSKPIVSSLDVEDCIVPTSDKKLEIATWNVENFPKTNTTTQELANIIKAMDVDVIALQEITSKNVLTTLDNLLPNYKAVIMISQNVHLAYLYKTSEISINGNPYGILKNKIHEFAGRTPYVLPIHSNNTDLDIILINNHFKAKGGEDNQNRRKSASLLIKNWIDSKHDTENVVVLGDMNDEITDKKSENVFQIFLDDTNNYHFADRKIALQENKSQWSYPSYPSHIDHILITNELFDNETNAYTYTFKSCDKNYKNIISDHQPVCVVFEK